ncbi:MAG: hypothetical protein NZL83_03470, partial [Candidatus Absconditabacterales bacterium]|nr:hypothetical protein [Candidatus Absconditabacterales bacterium]
MWHQIFADPTKWEVFRKNTILTTMFKDIIDKGRTHYGQRIKQIFTTRDISAYPKLSEGEKNFYLACLAETVIREKDPTQWNDIREVVMEIEIEKEQGTAKKKENNDNMQHIIPENFHTIANIYQQNGWSGQAICAEYVLAEYNRLFPDSYINIRSLGDAWDDNKNKAKIGGTWDIKDVLQRKQYKKFFGEHVDTGTAIQKSTLELLKTIKGGLCTLHNPTSHYKYKEGTKELQVTHVLISDGKGNFKHFFNGEVQTVAIDSIVVGDIDKDGMRDCTINGKLFKIHADSRIFLPKTENLKQYAPTTITANDPTLYPNKKVPTEISGIFFAEILADRYHISKSYICQRLVAGGYGLTGKYSPADLSVDLIVPPKTTIHQQYSFTVPESDNPEIQGKMTEIIQYAKEENIPASRLNNLLAIYLKENAGGEQRAVVKGFYHMMGRDLVGGFVRRMIDMYRKPDSFGMFQISRQTFLNSCTFPKPLSAGADQAQHNRYAREIQRISAYRQRLEKAWGNPIDRDALLAGPIDDKEVEIENMLLNNKFSFLVANELQRQTEDIFAQHLRDEYTGHINGDDLALTTLISHNLGIPRTHALIGQQNLFSLAEHVGIQQGSKFYVDGIWGKDTKMLLEKIKEKLCVTCPCDMVSLNNQKTESGQVMYTHIRYG